MVLIVISKVTYSLNNAFLFQERSSLLKRLGSIKGPEFSHNSSVSDILEEPVSITGLETFSLSYKVVVYPLKLLNRLP